MACTDTAAVVVDNLRSIDGDDDCCRILDAANLEKLRVSCVAEVDFVARASVRYYGFGIIVGSNVGDVLLAQCRRNDFADAFVADDDGLGHRRCRARPGRHCRP